MNISKPLIVAVMAVFPLSATQASDKVNPLSITVFGTSGPVMIGEPTVIRVRIANTSGEEVFLAPPAWGRGSVELAGVTKNRSIVVSDVNVEQDDGYSSLGIFGTRLRPRQSVVETYVIDQWNGWAPLTISARFLVDIRLQIPFKVRVRDAGPSYTLTAVVKLPVRVVETNREDLRKKAEALREKITKRSAKPPIGEIDVELDGLFSMNEETAGPSWRGLIEDHRSKPERLDAVRRHLRGIKTPFAADLLAEMWGKENDENRVLKAREDLLAMYSFGPKELREHIGNIFVAREGKLPDPITIRVQPGGF